MKNKGVFITVFAIIACDPGEDPSVYEREEDEVDVQEDAINSENEAAAMDDAEGTSRAAPPVPERGMWYNSARNGNGMEIYPRPGNTQIAFMWLTYTASEQPIWYRAELTPDAGMWEGHLLKSTWNGSSASSHVVGTAKLRRTNGQWRYEWTLSGISGNEPIERLSFGSSQPTMNLTGIWRSNQQPGWFVEFDSRGTTHVANLLIYAANGEPTWLQGVADSADTSLSFPMLYVRGNELCPGCIGTPSMTYQPVGTMTVQGVVGKPDLIYTSTSVTFPGGSWVRPGFTLSRGP